MKTLRIIANGLVAVALTLSMASCRDDEDDPLTTVNISSYDLSYNSDGYWTDCYNTSVAGFNLGTVEFSHAASAYEWGDYVYYSWYGFCPSKVSDTAEYANDWVSHQWASITGGGIKGAGSQYLVAFWSEYTNSGEQSLTIYRHGTKFQPRCIYLTNNTYGYYCMKNGSAYNRAFTDSDWYKVTITGYLSGAVTGTQECYLAKDGRIADYWQKVNLAPLGYVDTIVFSVSSSDTGEYGMNNPAYFCADGFMYEY